MAVVASNVEDRTRAYGRDIFARLDRRGPIPFTPVVARRPPHAD